MKRSLLAGMVLVAILAAARAGTNQYVSTSGSPVSPYINWAEAATNLAQALAATAAGNTIIVSNGVYRPIATTTIGKSVTITGLYGAVQTVMDGGGQVIAGLTIVSASVTATVYGLTITNFRGGGIYLNPGNLTLANCTLSGNSNSAAGGGIYAAGAGALSVTGCTIIGNTVPLNRNGGGIYSGITTCRVDNSFIMRNYGSAAGICSLGPITIRNCTIANNGVDSLYDGGGGVQLSSAASRLANSVIVSNLGANNGGGVLIVPGVIVENCLIAWNIGWTGGGIMNDAGMVRNCTIVHNTGRNWSGGVGAHAATYGTNLNCIVYSNYYNNYTAGLSGFFTNCCTTPLPAGPGNTAANPMFTNSAAGDFRLSKGSPCIDTGLYQTWMDAAMDLDGRPRIRQGAVDMGAYEYFLSKGVVVSFR